MASYWGRWANKYQNIGEKMGVVASELTPPNEGHERGSEYPLEIKNFSVEAQQPDGNWLPLVSAVSLKVRRGELAIIAGESGSGKTMLLMGALGLLDQSAYRTSGKIMVDGHEFSRLRASRQRRMLGKAVGVIFQDPYASLDPVATVGAQIAEAIKLHRKLSRSALRAESVGLLRRVGVPRPEQRYFSYPHEFSGGMRQRVMIAMALANSPPLVVADEPTTSLDVTVQAQIVRLMNRLQESLGSAVVFVTHDIALASEIGATIHVMYAGRIVESGAVAKVLGAPRHPYTHGLLRSLPTETDFVPIRGRPAVPGEWPIGCPFEPRCDWSVPQCHEPQELIAVDGREVACHRAQGPDRWWSL